MRRIWLCCMVAGMFATPSIGAVVSPLLVKAYRDGAVARVQGCVVDEKGIPLSNAFVRVLFRSINQRRDDAELSVWTDGEGLFELAHRTNWKIECHIMKDGYYDSNYEISFYDAERAIVKDGLWTIPDEMNRRIVLRKILSEKALFVFPEGKRMGTWRIPLTNEWVGFDFEYFDWVKPYGKGKWTDMLLRFSSETRGHIRGRYQMEVSFTNNPYAGAYRGSADKISDLKIPHRADMSKDYVNYYCFLRDTIGDVRKDTFPGPNDYLVFRTRTQTDAEGFLASAHYGVISGTWISSETVMRMDDAAFNPVENDADIEDGYYLRYLLRQYEQQHR